MNDIATDASRQFDQSYSDDQLIAVITGGAAGIGEAIARRLSADGFVIVIADLDGGRAEALAADISGRGGHAREASSSTFQYRSRSPPCLIGLLMILVRATYLSTMPESPVPRR